MSDPLAPLSPADYVDILRRQQEKLEAATEEQRQAALALNEAYADMVADATDATPAQRALYHATMVAVSATLAAAEAFKSAQLANAMQVAIMYQPEQFKSLRAELIQELSIMRDQLLISLSQPRNAREQWREDTSR